MGPKGRQMLARTNDSDRGMGCLAVVGLNTQRVFCSAKYNAVVLSLARSTCYHLQHLEHLTCPGDLAW